MICKFCNEEFDSERFVFCPFCGKSLNDEPADVQENTDSDGGWFLTDEMPEAEQEWGDTEESSSENTFEDEEGEDKEPEEEPKRKGKLWTRIVAIVCAVLALVALAFALMVAMGYNPITKIREKMANNGTVYEKSSYVVSEEKLVDKADKVVATVGDKKLTNSQLNIYYHLQVYDFVEYYGSYLSYMGFDTATPLDQQTCGLDTSMTWEQYFIEVAIKTWQNYATMAIMGEEAGFTLSEEAQAELDGFAEQMETQAASSGYDSAEAMIQELLGTSCTLDAYTEYVELSVYANNFYSEEYTRLTPTDEDVKAYFTENEDAFAEQGITMDGGLISDVRHILIGIDGGTTDEDGNTVYTEEEKAAAYAEAEALLAQWKAGEATEESFAALAVEYSEDGGVTENEGLYTGIYPGAGYVENFLSWSIDMSRQSGDTDIVESDYGYHIMYFVDGEPYWLYVAGTQLLSERTTALLEEGAEKWPADVDYGKIVVIEVSLS